MSDLFTAKETITPVSAHLGGSADVVVPAIPLAGTTTELTGGRPPSPVYTGTLSAFPRTDSGVVAGGSAEPHQVSQPPATQSFKRDARWIAARADLVDDRADEPAAGGLARRLGATFRMLLVESGGEAVAIDAIARATCARCSQDLDHVRVGVLVEREHRDLLRGALARRNDVVTYLGTTG